MTIRDVMDISSDEPKSAQNLRLLFVAPFPPQIDGLHGGAKVIASIIRALSTKHEVAVLYLHPRDEAPIDDTLASCCAFAEGISIENRRSFVAKVWHKLSEFPTTPSWASGTWSEALMQRIKQVAQTWNPDIIHFEYHVMGQYCRVANECAVPCVVTEHEPGITAAREHGVVTREWRNLMLWWRYWTWARFERRILNKANAVVVFTERDRESLQELRISAPIACIPFRTAVREIMLSSIELASVPDLVFIGNFAHPPNVDAAERLVGSIYPSVLASKPDVTLHIVGANPPISLKSCERDSIYITGRVDDVSVYLAHASIVVVPLRQGGGMRVKVLEALAAGKAVIASPLAVEGLPVKAGVHFLEAKTDQDFIQSILELLHRPERLQQLGDAAHSWACEWHDIPTWIAQYEALYAMLIGIGIRCQGNTENLNRRNGAVRTCKRIARMTKCPR
jgi:glycosyltransferase involved in cell wall biosynthesis